MQEKQQLFALLSANRAVIRTFLRKSNLTPLQIVSIAMLFHLGFKVLKPLLQLLNRLTLEAIGCLQLPNPFR